MPREVGVLFHRAKAGHTRPLAPRTPPTHPFQPPLPTHPPTHLPQLQPAAHAAEATTHLKHVEERLGVAESALPPLQKALRKEHKRVGLFGEGGGHTALRASAPGVGCTRQADMQEEHSRS